MDGTNPMLSIPSHSSLPNLEVPIPARPVLILATGGGCSSHRRHPRILDSGVGQKEVFGVVQEDKGGEKINWKEEEDRGTPVKIFKKIP
ncbi:hypothetical protein [Oryza sativa Japonica Group]|uniref:Uncharacterized protein n=1 Tax=Oryza sativa subsp. japonica TaxID=39947 RepID=Q5ZBG7_ORYSJ|nr:hypothetical protein [Oryza sativa Japonica Group]BAD61528.1 hypothetical protein [Oryza sativa Japonica Group]